VVGSAAIVASLPAVSTAVSRRQAYTKPPGGGDGVADPACRRGVAEYARERPRNGLDARRRALANHEPASTLPGDSPVADVPAERDALTTFVEALVPGSPATVEVTLERQEGPRNRLTAAFRAVLAVPHMLLAGLPPWFPGGSGVPVPWNLGINGGLGAMAMGCAIVSWFAILFTRRQPRGLWDLQVLYLRWRTRAIAYIALLRDEYPPFGDGDYPASLAVAFPEGDRDRLSVALRLVYAAPHAVIVITLGLAWLATSIVAWFAILFTGRYPASLEAFGVGVLRWSIRLEAYVLLVRDEYPPFRLGP
jgi:hypothetical protein